MKCGLLPLCHEAMTLGEIAYSEYTGGGPDDVASMQKALSSNAKVRYHSLIFYGISNLQHILISNAIHHCIPCGL